MAQYNKRKAGDGIRYLKRYNVVETETELPIQGQVRDPNDLYKFLQDLQDEQVDKIVGIYLDDNFLFLGHQVFLGATSGTFDTALLYHFYSMFLAKRFILIVNHTSGDSTPTDNDLELMQSLKIDSRLISFHPLFDDFVIVGHNQYFSMSINDGTACKCGRQHYFQDI